MTIPDDRERLVERVVSTLKDAPDLDPGLTDRIMAEVRTPPRSWWLVPRPIRLAPIHLAVASAAIAVLLAAAWTAGATRTGEEAATAGARRVVQFHLIAPGADSVMLVGDFNDWEVGATPLHPAGRPGVWTVDVPLAPGLVKYAFVIDGNRWVTDPSTATTFTDEFGGAASYLRVGGPS